MLSEKLIKKIQDQKPTKASKIEHIKSVMAGKCVKVQFDPENKEFPFYDKQKNRRFSYLEIREIMRKNELKVYFSNNETSVAFLELLDSELG